LLFLLAKYHLRTVDNYTHTSYSAYGHASALSSCLPVALTKKRRQSQSLDATNRKLVEGIARSCAGSKEYKEGRVERRYEDCEAFKINH